MSGQGGGQSGGGFGDGQEMNMVYIAIALVAAFLFIGFLFWDRIVEFIFFVKLHELKLIGFFDSSSDIPSLILWAEQRQNLNQVGHDQLVALMQVVGNFLRYPLAAISVLFALILVWRHPDRGFKDVESMETLREKMKGIFPAIKVVSDLGLDQVPIDKGPWMMGLTPIEFAKAHKLISKADDGKIVVDAMKAKAIFTRQLGAKWQGAKMLKPHQKALFAVLSAYICYERKAADAMLEQMASSATFANVKAGKIDYSGIDEMLKKYGSSPQVKEIISKHAYVLTIFSQMLSMGRKTGIIANALFLWIKPIDRPMWYALNNVGRQAVFSETGAVTAHWTAEKQLGYAISTPMIDSAVEGLEVAIASRLIRNIE